MVKMGKLLETCVPIPQNDLFADNPSRRLVGIMDSGMLKILTDDGNGRFWKGSTRHGKIILWVFIGTSTVPKYNIACNNTIRVGQIIQVVIPDVGHFDQVTESG